eukprot:scaffold57943_cov28-Tisochrysis_lutea.AAC.1
MQIIAHKCSHTCCPCAELLPLVWLWAVRSGEQQPIILLAKLAECLPATLFLQVGCEECLAAAQDTGGCEECLAAAQDTLRLRLHLVQPSKGGKAAASSAEGALASGGEFPRYELCTHCAEEVLASSDNWPLGVMVGGQTQLFMQRLQLHLPLPPASVPATSSAEESCCTFGKQWPVCVAMSEQEQSSFRSQRA